MHLNEFNEFEINEDGLKKVELKTLSDKLCKGSKEEIKKKIFLILFLRDSPYRPLDFEIRTTSAISWWSMKGKNSVES